MNKVQTKSALVDGLVDDRCFVYLSIRINVLCSGVIVSGVCFFFVVVIILICSCFVCVLIFLFLFFLSLLWAYVRGIPDKFAS